MTLHDALIKALTISIQKEKQIPLQKTKPNSTNQTNHKKRVTNWNAIESSIKKYDSLSSLEKTKADANWGRTIPYWKHALQLHKNGLSDKEIFEKLSQAKKS